MENKTVFRAFLPLLFIFIIISAVSITGGSFLTRWRIEPDVVIIGNLILFIATAVSFYLYSQSLRNNRVQVILRKIYGGMFIKMFICLITALVYIMAEGKEVNKGGIFVCMFLYFVYSFLEISVLMKLSKQNKNA